MSEKEAMAWFVSEEEVDRARALDVDARYAYAIDKIREHGELWTLESDDGWVVRRTDHGLPSIPIWPHERFAEIEATGAWQDARPSRILLVDDWFTEGRAAWFEKNGATVTVFLSGASSMCADFSTVVELIRGEARDRYP